MCLDHLREQVPHDYFISLVKGPKENKKSGMDMGLAIKTFHLLEKATPPLSVPCVTWRDSRRERHK